MIDIGSAAIGRGERGRAQHGQLTSNCMNQSSI
jgi:hypothetical protein